MMKNYYALKASLPTLLFDGELPVTRSGFLEQCRSALDETHFAFLESLSLPSRELPAMRREIREQFLPENVVKQQITAAGVFQQFEIALRNALAQRRAGKLGREASGTVPFAEYVPEASRIAAEAFSAGGTPLERERMLDRARWDFLENLEWKHAFDFDGLCIYCFKLQILEKWHARKNGDALKNLDAAASAAEQSQHISQ